MVYSELGLESTDLLIFTCIIFFQVQCYNCYLRVTGLVSDGQGTSQSVILVDGALLVMTASAAYRGAAKQ